MLTQEELKKVLRYDEGTGNFIWLVTASPTAVKGSVAGTSYTRWAKIRINKKGYMTHRLVWLYVYGKFPVGSIDHIDRNPLNNRLSNLREATHSQNGFNTGIRCSNTSGYKGVTWCKEKRKWKAQATVENKVTALGYFENALSASAAYNNFIKEKHGEFYNDTAHNTGIIQRRES